MHPGTGASLHNREEAALHLDVYQRDGMRSLWNVPVDVVSQSCQEVLTVAEALESKVQPAFVFQRGCRKRCDAESLVERGSPACNTRTELAVQCLIAMEPTALKPWLVKSVKETDCKVFDQT